MDGIELEIVWSNLISIVSEQANKHFPQHLDLTIRPVTGMELHTAVTAIQTWSLIQRSNWAVHRDVGLQPAEQGLLARFKGFVLQIRGMGSDRAECQLQLTYVPAEVGEEPMANQGFCGVARASQHLRCSESVAIGCGLHTRPEGGGGMCQPEMHVAMLGE